MSGGEVYRLHGYYRSSAAFRVRIALHLKGVAYESVAHHLRRGEQRSDAYLAVNPQGLVPALEADGLVLTQSLAIIEYLDERHPEPALLPPDPAARARARAIAQTIACDIHPIDNLRVLAYLRGELAQPEASVTQWYAHWIAEGFTALEEGFRARPPGAFCIGDTPTIADICLVPQVINARNFAVDLEPYPLLVAVAERALALSAFAAAHPANQPDAE